MCSLWKKTCEQKIGSFFFGSTNLKKYQLINASSHGHVETALRIAKCRHFGVQSAMHRLAADSGFFSLEVLPHLAHLPRVAFVRPHHTHGGK